MYYLGVDLGGTNIFVGLVDENGKIISKTVSCFINFPYLMSFYNNIYNLNIICG